jgi:NADP-dependent aldehyde dehydrogenase
VGTGAISRFLRPVAYQNLAQSLLPEVLRDNGGAAWRRLEGELTRK